MEKRKTKSLPWRARTKSTLRVDEICGDAADEILPLVGLGESEDIELP